MNTTLTTPDPTFTAALRRELTALPERDLPKRARRRLAIVAAGAISCVSLGGMAVAGLLPAGEMATAPLAPPFITSGVGPTTVAVPEAPEGAAYLRMELICFDSARCETPGGSVTGPSAGPKIQRDALPLTETYDPSNPQSLDPLRAGDGVPIGVDAGSHWRLYAVFTDGLNPEPAPVGNGMTLGIPSNEYSPDLVPAVSDAGTAGWVRFTDLVERSSMDVVDDDGVTVVGSLDLAPRRR